MQIAYNIIIQVTQFCDNDTSSNVTLHNTEAKNEHNDKCGGRSAWEVMREHKDFKGWIHLYLFYIER